MLIVSSTLVLLISFIVFVLFVRRSYLKNVKESLCIFTVIIGFNCTSIAICLYYANVGGASYLLNKYFFISKEYLTFFKKLNVSIFGIANLLSIARLLFIVGIYCFIAIIIDHRFSIIRVLPLLIPIIVIGANISNLYIELIQLFKTLSAPISQTISIFDWITRLCMIPTILILLIWLIRYYINSYNAVMRRNILLLFGGLILISVEYTLILDLTPSSLANVYTNSYFIQFMNQLVHNTKNHSSVLLVGLTTILLIVISFSLVIISSINIMRLKNFNKVSSITVNKSISIADAQNLIPFLHSLKNQLVSLTQFEAIMNIDNYNDTLPMIKSITKEMTQTIDYIYGNSRDIKLNIVLSDVNTCIQQAIDTVRLTKRVKISFESKGQALAMIDQEYIRHALENIIYNAADACADRKDGLIQIVVTKKKHFLEVNISDNGIGINKENLKKIMEPFYSTKNKTHSWGMGLNHVKKIITAHNGRVQFSSEKGSGTSVLVLLPTGK